MLKVFAAPKCLRPAEMHYCPGCGHAVLQRLLAGAIDRLGAAGRVIGLGSAGCAARMADYLDLDMGQAPHGKAVAVAMGVKLAAPQSLVFAYQGDHQMAASELEDALDAAHRGLGILYIQVNNSGGPLPGPAPLPLIAHLAGPGMAGLASLHGPQAIEQAGEAIAAALAAQERGKGFAYLQVEAPCPTKWRLSPAQAMARLAEIAGRPGQGESHDR